MNRSLGILLVFQKKKKKKTCLFYFQSLKKFTLVRKSGKLTSPDLGAILFLYIAKKKKKRKKKKRR